MNTPSIATARAFFPALADPTIRLDGPGGSQTAQPVLDAIVGYLVGSNANLVLPRPARRVLRVEDGESMPWRRRQNLAARPAWPPPITTTAASRPVWVTDPR